MIVKMKKIRIPKRIDFNVCTTNAGRDNDWREEDIFEL